ncbi:DUF2145 domain-containing protein [Aquincola sp. S2]|uniref:DUF2145 domain-containing protein n=1 Tax=Pseudaquabacterium terrae TaxID=2732868 RepID=A0ABX2EM02_9BURK|nr:DUF2145 domain-containing protein [Aquabacterium terrae]NRF69581.1 DUF2145 domain-containing protein [Aquabacterium terrae]
MKALLAAALIAAATTAHAGRPCEQKPAEAASVERGMNLAAATAKQLDASGAQVVLLARAGQDLGKYGLRYSHLGFVYREQAGGRPVWRVMHKLNHCGTADAALYRQGLGEFFLDNPHRYEAAFVVLSAELQAKLLPLLRDNQRAALLNERHYNMVAYPWSTRYQQSNQWALETLAAAADGARDRAQVETSVQERSGPALLAAERARAQAWLIRQGYQPTPLKLGAFSRLGARATSANIAFDDHPNEKRFADRIETVTVDSMFEWLARSGWGATPVTVR